MFSFFILNLIVLKIKCLVKIIKSEVIFVFFRRKPPVGTYMLVAISAAAVGAMGCAALCSRCNMKSLKRKASKMVDKVVDNIGSMM